MSILIVNQIQTAFHNAFQSYNDDDFAKVIQEFIQEPSVYTHQESCAFYEAFDCAEFFLNSKNQLMRNIAYEVLRFKRNVALKQLIMDRTSGKLEGLELSNKDGTFFCVFTHETYEGARDLVRATWFSAQGFRGHINARNWNELLDEVFNRGYVTEAPGILDALSKSAAFIQGSAVKQPKVEWLSSATYPEKTAH
ncbi:MAG: hypothetical protein EOO52_13255 [Gammaproteobacteria bacterium]|nr:MAG: hypothetical protein EOO52_13255 [Gammaproteobacteria bacterium]